MRLSRETLLAESEATGFRPEILEKAFHLLGLLEGFRDHPFLRGRLALKGGTALNLFVFDLPRLSVDIDLNYVGEPGIDRMREERPLVERALQAVFSREGFRVARVPDAHAGGKWRLAYESALGQTGELQVDLNYMFRTPLWPIVIRDSRGIGSFRTEGIPLLDVHELAAGKLAALMARRASRDLFDAHSLLVGGDLQPERLRQGFVVYGAMSRKDWRTVRVDDVAFEDHELATQLLPMLRSEAARLDLPTAPFGRHLVEECRAALACVLPLSEKELLFLDRLLDGGEIVPELITEDPDLAERIRTHPSLQWKAFNVRRAGKSARWTDGA